MPWTSCVISRQISWQIACGLCSHHQKKSLLLILITINFNFCVLVLNFYLIIFKYFIELKSLVVSTFRLQKALFIFFFISSFSTWFVFVRTVNNNTCNTQTCFNAITFYVSRHLVNTIATHKSVNINLTIGVV